MRRKLKTKKLIDLHKEWCETGKMPECGLCASVWTRGVSGHSGMRYRNAIDKYFKPTIYERLRMSKNGESYYFWASGVKRHNKRSLVGYTELRQNIVLLICAMFDEL